MKRILRSFLTLLMLVVWASGFAADKTYSYTFASKIFTSESETKSLNNIDWTLSAERMISNEVTYFGVDKKKVNNLVRVLSLLKQLHLQLRV